MLRCLHKINFLVNFFGFHRRNRWDVSCALLLPNLRHLGNIIDQGITNHSEADRWLSIYSLLAWFWPGNLRQAYSPFGNLSTPLWHLLDADPQLEFWTWDDEPKRSRSLLILRLRVPVLGIYDTTGRIETSCNYPRVRVSFAFVMYLLYQWLCYCISTESFLLHPVPHDGISLFVIISVRTHPRFEKERIRRQNSFAWKPSMSSIDKVQSMGRSWFDPARLSSFQDSRGHPAHDFVLKLRNEQ